VQTCALPIFRDWAEVSAVRRNLSPITDHHQNCRLKIAASLPPHSSPFVLAKSGAFPYLGEVTFGIMAGARRTLDCRHLHILLQNRQNHGQGPAGATPGDLTLYSYSHFLAWKP